MTTAGYRLSKCEAGFWAPCDSSCQEDPKSVYLLFQVGSVPKSLLTAFTQSKNVQCRVTCEV